MRYNQSLVPHAQRLRHEQTSAEKILWSRLRNRQLNGIKFRRQYPIRKSIIDFYCDTKKLGIELDGSQHIGAARHDAIRTQVLNRFGITILRFWNTDVTQNIEGVMQYIAETLNTVPPHLYPLLKERK